MNLQKKALENAEKKNGVLYGMYLDTHPAESEQSTITQVDSCKFTGIEVGLLDQNYS